METVMKLRLLATILIIACGTTEFATAMKRSDKEDRDKRATKRRGAASQEAAAGGAAASSTVMPAPATASSSDPEPTSSMPEAPDVCPICHAEYSSESTDVHSLPCNIKHRFHTTCINSWFEINPTCPLCKEKAWAAPVKSIEAKAALNGDLATLHSRIINHHTRLDTLEIGQRTLLHLAVFNGHTEVVKFLLRLMPKVNYQGNDGITALHLAALYGHTAIVEALLKNTTINPALRTVSDKTAFDMAATDEIRALIQAHTLCKAAMNNNFAQVVELSCIAGLDFNAQDDRGFTALHWAAENNNREIAELLIGAPGIKVNGPSGSRYTPLSIAALAGHKEIVVLLCSIPGIDVNAYAGKRSNTPLHLAALRGHIATVAILLAIDEVNSTTINGYGETAWYLARTQEIKDLIQARNTARLAAGGAGEEPAEPESEPAEPAGAAEYEPASKKSCIVM
jgi:uncharacterized protein